MLVPLLSLTSRSLLPFLVVSKVQLLEEGIAERIEALLRSESPPVQFKLLGTLRMLADGQGRHLPTLTGISSELPSSLILQTRLRAECPANPISFSLESFQQRLLPEAAHAFQTAPVGLRGSWETNHMEWIHSSQWESGQRPKKMFFTRDMMKERQFLVSNHRAGDQ